MKDIEGIADEDLVEAYLNAAIRQSEAHSARVANRNAKRLLQIAGEIRRRGPVAQTKLLALLEHRNVNVRLWAATHSLDFASEQAEFVLRVLAKEREFIGLNAQITLELWKKGTLVFP
jgi:hypothetical protein